MKLNYRKILLSFIFIGASIVGFAQNPFITHRYTADPTARVYNDTLFVYPSGDTICEQGQGNNGFCMQGYNVFSTTDLTNWTDHGRIISHNNVPWVKPNSYGMWAPDCSYKNGKYYFYFPAIPTDSSNFRNIGVAISDSPTGPFVPEPNYIQGVTGIDPNVFIDDGKAYLYFGGGETLYGVELNDDMVSVKGKPQVIEGLPAKYKEGPFVFKRKGIYYFTFPHAPEGSEEISYAMGNNPLGPFEYKAKVLERWKDGCWTNHHSFVEYKDQWYLFYHSKEISGSQHLRSVCVDKIYFADDGTIPEIKATKRGIGRIFAKDLIQIDRYSTLQNANIERTEYDYINWVVKNISNKSLIAYNAVEFDNTEYSSIIAYVSSPSKGGKMQVYGNNNKLLATFELPHMRTGEWRAVKAKLAFSPKETQNLLVKFSGTVRDAKLDWIKFLPKEAAAVVASPNVQMNFNSEEILSFETNCLLFKPQKFNPQSIEISNKSEIESLSVFVNEAKENQLQDGIAGDVMNLVSTAKMVYYDPYKGVKMSASSDQNGITFENCTLGGENAAYIENGDNIMFENLSYEKAPKEIEVQVACQSLGGSIEIRKNGLEGELLATVPVKSTGGFQKWENTHAQLSGNIENTDKLYFIFKGGKGFLFNVNSFTFK